MDFLRKTVIITGGASGMGFLCGKCFAAQGANIVLADINEQALREKSREISESGGKVICTVTDVRDYKQVCAAKDAAIAAFGSIDILINCAGGSEPRMLNTYMDFADMPIEVYDWGIDVNLKGPFYFAHAVMKQMVKQHSGVIINIGSVTGEEGDGMGMAYPTAKSGIMYGLTRSLAIYGAPHNIRAVCVTPGPVLTREAMANMTTVMGRAAEPQEIVNMILFLASDKASFVTGSNHVVDGGRLVTPRKWGYDA